MNVWVHVPHNWFGITELVIMHVIDDLLCVAPWPLLLTWINYNLSMNKSIPKLQRLYRWSLGIDK